MENIDIKREIKTLLIRALPDENLNNYDIEIVGSTGKGDNFLSDLYFVDLTSEIKNYNFVLKCGKRCDVLREHVPLKHTFEQEIYMYATVFPAFRKFQIERNIQDIFDSVPKCYGTCTYQENEVIVLQNLKTFGYDICDKKSPLPRNHLETVLKQYGKWHAISAAMQNQEPQNFQKLVNSMHDIWGEFCDATDFPSVFVSAIETITKLWENDMDEIILIELKQLKDHTHYYLSNLRKKSKSLNVITHGDCWSNNFMFKVVGGNGKSKDVDVVVIDWQIAGFSSPIIDLSYFLYGCVSEEDLKDFDDLLQTYYDSFAGHLTKLGSNPEKIYNYSNLLDDWKRYGRVGIIHALLLCRVINAEDDHSADIAQIAEQGGDFRNAFCPNIKDINAAKQRSKYIIQHAVERDLIKPTRDF